MILTICLSLSLLLLILSLVMPLKLHLYEIIFIWVVATFLHQIIYYVITQNYKLWKSPSQMTQFWELIISRKVSMPLLLIWFIEISRKWKSLSIKTALWLAFLSLMVGLDYIMNYAEIVHFVTWSVWKSYLVWFLISTLCFLLLKWYRVILRREKFI